MEFLWYTDWRRLFVPQMSLLEILLRGTLTYLAICLLLRVVLKRQAGKVSMSDLLVVTIAAGVCRNPLVADAYSVTDGVLVVSTVLLWSYGLDWLCYNFPSIHKLFHAPPVPLVRNGEIMTENLRRELMTEGQLHAKLRRKGARDLAEVAEAWMEGDGHVSVIKKQDGQPLSARQEPVPATEPKEEGHETNGVSLDGPPEVRAFLDAARHLEEKIARHQQGIAEAKELLERYGYRLKGVRGALRRKPKDLPEDETTAAGPGG